MLPPKTPYAAFLSAPQVVQLYNVSLIPIGNPSIKSQSQLNKEKDTMSMKLISKDLEVTHHPVEMEELDGKD